MEKRNNKFKYKVYIAGTILTHFELVLKNRFIVQVCPGDTFDIPLTLKTLIPSLTKFRTVNIDIFEKIAYNVEQIFQSLDFC